MTRALLCFFAMRNVYSVAAELETEAMHKRTKAKMLCWLLSSCDGRSTEGKCSRSWKLSKNIDSASRKNRMKLQEVARRRKRRIKKINCMLELNKFNNFKWMRWFPKSRLRLSRTFRLGMKMKLKLCNLTRSVKVEKVKNYCFECMTQTHMARTGANFSWNFLG